MTTSVSEPIEISRFTPAFLRWGLAAFGLAIGGVALAELWGAVWPLSIVTPFFGLIMAIALCAGGGLALGALFGPDEAWRIEPGHLTIHQSLRGVRAQQHYTPANIAAITLETSDWDSRPATYCLAIRLVSGKVLKSPEFGTEAKAAAAMAMLAKAD